MTREQIIQKIAREELGIETLATRGNDSLDFHDLAVWSLDDALGAAYDAGAASLLQAAELLLAAKENGMETPEEWKALRSAVRKAHKND